VGEGAYTVCVRNNEYSKIAMK